MDSESSGELEAAPTRGSKSDICLFEGRQADAEHQGYLSLPPESNPVRNRGDTSSYVERCRDCFSYPENSSREGHLRGRAFVIPSFFSSTVRLTHLTWGRTSAPLAGPRAFRIASLLCALSTCTTSNFLGRQNTAASCTSRVASALRAAV